MNVPYLRVTHLLITMAAAILPGCTADVATDDAVTAEDELASKKPNLTNLAVAQAAVQALVDERILKKANASLYDPAAAEVRLVHAYDLDTPRSKAADLGYLYCAWVPKKAKNVGIFVELQAELKGSVWTLDMLSTWGGLNAPRWTIISESAARAKATAAGVPASAKQELIFYFPVSGDETTPSWEFHWGSKYLWVTYDGEVLKKPRYG